MKIKKLLFLLFLSVISCTSQEQKPKVISFSEIKNLNDLFFKVDSLSCKGYSPSLEYETGNIKSLMPLLPKCSKTIISHKLRNSLQLTTDSILNKDGYPISQLDSLMYLHYINPHDDNKFSSSPHKAIVTISLINSDLKELPVLCERINNAFKKLQNRTDKYNDLILYVKIQGKISIK